MYIFAGTGLGQSSSTIDVRRAIEQNRKYSTQLGWYKYYDRINPLLGFPDFSPDETTFAKAVADWQQKCGLTVDGTIDSNTWSRMKAVIGLTQPGSGEKVKKRVLRFKFRHNYLDFQREVEQAIGRWTVYRSDQGQRVRWLMGKWRKDYLLKVHTKLLHDKATEGSMVVVDAHFVYKGQPSNEGVVEVILLVWYYDTPRDCAFFRLSSHCRT